MSVSSGCPSAGRSYMSTRPTANSTAEGITVWSNLPSPGTLWFMGQAPPVLFTDTSVHELFISP